MSIVDPAYFGREQTAVKHRVLERYLTPLPLIVGRTWVKDVTFVDCCSGPWNTTTDDQTEHWRPRGMRSTSAACS